jgi:DNA mismatch repair protein MutL
MPGKIKLLNEKVISHIAAGEVIERPASVIKELVENSIDAGASKIIIDVEEGGKKLIRVEDNGSGMECSDAEIAFLRHSTSKIDTLRDLEAISSLGFRGEALASIAAVSKVLLVTKLPEAEAGTEVVVEGGKIRHVRDAAANTGTIVTVSELFYNTPARRKYLKTTRTELARITDLVTRVALIHPGIFIKLIHNKVEVINTPKTDNPLETITHIYGREMAREMLPVEYADLDIRIEGFISKPAVTRKTRSHISFFVNSRYVVSTLLSSALKEGYGNLIMKKNYPAAVLNLKVNPRKIDVNVHPTKLEIRFEDDSAVHKAIQTAVEDTLRKYSLIPDMGSKDIDRPNLLTFGSAQEEFAVNQPAIPVIEAQRQVDIETFKSKTDRQEKTSIPHKPSTLPRMSLIGQILDTYIVAQSGEDILLIDQHAAHERVLFERLQGIGTGDRRNRQDLLAPLTLELTPGQKGFVAANKDMLDDLGFRFEHFGGNTFLVTAMPVTLGDIGDVGTVSNIIDELTTLGTTKRREELLEKAAAIVACHSAIRGGDILSPTQMRDLLASLYGTTNVYSCPHGRPTILSITKNELEKRFKRK